MVSDLTWKERLKLPIEKKSPLHLELIDLAFSWKTCIVAELAKDVPKTHALVPLDLKLFYLGVMFTRHVNRYEIGDALDVIEEVEKRLIEINADVYPLTDTQ